MSENKIITDNATTSDAFESGCPCKLYALTLITPNSPISKISVLRIKTNCCVIASYNPTEHSIMKKITIVFLKKVLVFSLIANKMLNKIIGSYNIFTKNPKLAERPNKILFIIKYTKETIIVKLSTYVFLSCLLDKNEINKKGREI